MIEQPFRTTTHTLLITKIGKALSYKKDHWNIEMVPVIRWYDYWEIRFYHQQRGEILKYHFLNLTDGFFLCYRSWLIAESKWSRWSAWTDCTKTCGTGTRQRNRTCAAINKRAVFAPISCAGKSRQVKSCAEWNCPGWYMTDDFHSYTTMHAITSYKTSNV